MFPWPREPCTVLCCTVLYCAVLYCNAAIARLLHGDPDEGDGGEAGAGRHLGQVHQQGQGSQQESPVKQVTVLLLRWLLKNEDNISTFYGISDCFLNGVNLKFLFST